jgi:hypothetical protein
VRNLLIGQALGSDQPDDVDRQPHGLSEEGLGDLVSRVGRLVVVRVVFDAELQEGYAGRMKRPVIG